MFGFEGFGAGLLAATSAVAPSPQTSALVPVCLVRTIKDAGDRDRDAVIVVPESIQAVVMERGYQVKSCTSLMLRIAEYREQVCRMAAYGNEAVQDRFETVIGVRPKVLCDAVNILGPQLDALGR